MKKLLSFIFVLIFLILIFTISNLDIFNEINNGSNEIIDNNDDETDFVLLSVDEIYF